VVTEYVCTKCGRTNSSYVGTPNERLLMGKTENRISISDSLNCILSFSKDNIHSDALLRIEPDLAPLINEAITKYKELKINKVI
jgi:hypothetical protein